MQLADVEGLVLEPSMGLFPIQCKLSRRRKNRLATIRGVSIYSNCKIRYLSRKCSEPRFALLDYLRHVFCLPYIVRSDRTKL